MRSDRLLAILLLLLVPVVATLFPMFAIWLERKVSAHMQSRLGPMEAGPYGSMQLFAEVGKWLQKEDLAPEKADRRLFVMAPFVVVVSAFLVYVAVPFGPDAFAVGGLRLLRPGQRIRASLSLTGEILALTVSTLPDPLDND